MVGTCLGSKWSLKKSKSKFWFVIVTRWAFCDDGDFEVSHVCTLGRSPVERNFSFHLLRQS